MVLPQMSLARELMGAQGRQPKLTITNWDNAIKNCASILQDTAEHNRRERVVGGIFFPTPMPKPPGGPEGPTHFPPTPFEKTFISILAPKFKYMELKFKYTVAKFKYIAPKLKYAAPKFKHLTSNSNT